MATITCRCTGCNQTIQAELQPPGPLHCPACEHRLTDEVPDVARQKLEDCLVCPSRELFVRKDFPQRLGLLIVLAGFGASIVTWYFHQVIATFAILFGTALVDVVLYLVMGDVVECYRCHAQYRETADLKSHAPFDLEIHERYRQEAARLKQQPIE